MRAVIITRVGREPLVDAETLSRVVLEAFPGQWRSHGDAAPMIWVIDVSPPGQPGFLVQLGRDGKTVHCDGTPEQCAAVAAGVAQVAAGTSRLIGFGGDWEWHVDLVPGITPEQVLTGRVEHDENWSDPELEGS